MSAHADTLRLPRHATHPVAVHKSDEDPSPCGTCPPGGTPPPNPPMGPPAPILLPPHLCHGRTAQHSAPLSCSHGWGCRERDRRARPCDRHRAGLARRGRCVAFCTLPSLHFPAPCPILSTLLSLSTQRPDQHTYARVSAGTRPYPRRVADGGEWVSGRACSLRARPRATLCAVRVPTQACLTANPITATALLAADRAVNRADRIEHLTKVMRARKVLSTRTLYSGSAYRV